MRHIPDGVLRRLDDEPLAVPDRVTDHLDGAASAAALAGPRSPATPSLRCACSPLRTSFLTSTSRGGLGSSASSTANRLTPRRRVRARPLATCTLPQDVAARWTGHRRRRHRARGHGRGGHSDDHLRADSRGRAVPERERSARDRRVGRAGRQRVAGCPERVERIEAFRFGTISWSSSPSQPAASLSRATAQAGFPVALPAHLPAGVGRLQQLGVQPRVSATVTFNAKAATLAGSSVRIDAGPAVLAQYSAASGPGVPTLAVTTMRRPTADSSGASLSQIEAFMLDQPGVPPELAEEVRLLGDLRTTLPVPVPSGASVRSVKIDGSPGVLLADASVGPAGPAAPMGPAGPAVPEVTISMYASWAVPPSFESIPITCSPARSPVPRSPAQSSSMDH